MSRRMKVWSWWPSCSSSGAQGALVAWAATNTSSASDGGNTVRVGATSATATPGRRSSQRRSTKAELRVCRARTSRFRPSDAATFGPGRSHSRELVFRQMSRKDVDHLQRSPLVVPGLPAVCGFGSRWPRTHWPCKRLDSLTLPSPVVDLNPSSFSVVNLSSWLWIDRQNWHSFSATATAGGVSATAVAMPETVSWSMGDGHTVRLRRARDPISAGDLAPRNRRPTARTRTHRRRPASPAPMAIPTTGRFASPRRSTWTVSWSATGVAGGGTLPALHTSSTVPVRVEQVESVGTAG